VLALELRGVETFARCFHLDIAREPLVNNDSKVGPRLHASQRRLANQRHGIVGQADELAHGLDQLLQRTAQLIFRRAVRRRARKLCLRLRAEARDDLRECCHLQPKLAESQSRTISECW
jgi:hypothetical protein